MGRTIQLGVCCIEHHINLFRIRCLYWAILQWRSANWIKTERREKHRRAEAAAKRLVVAITTIITRQKLHVFLRLHQALETRDPAVPFPSATTRPPCGVHFMTPTLGKKGSTLPALSPRFAPLLRCELPYYQHRLNRTGYHPASQYAAIKALMSESIRTPPPYVDANTLPNVSMSSPHPLHHQVAVGIPLPWTQPCSDTIVPHNASSIPYLDRSKPPPTAPPLRSWNPGSSDGTLYNYPDILPATHQEAVSASPASFDSSAPEWSIQHQLLTAQQEESQAQGAIERSRKLLFNFA